MTQPAAPVRSHFGGAMTVASIGDISSGLAALHPDGDLTIDLSGVERIDTTGAWLVHKLLRIGRRRGVR